MYYAESDTEKTVALVGCSAFTFNAKHSHFRLKQGSTSGIVQLKINEYVRAVSKEKAEAYLSQFDYTEVIQNGAITVSAVEPVVDKEQNEAEWLLVLAEVAVDVKLNVKIDAGHISGDGFKGKLLISGGQGNVDVTGLQGDVDISLTNGNIYVDTLSGDISVMTERGNIIMRSNLNGAERLVGSATMGNIDLYVPQGRPFSIMASTRSGTVNRQIEMDSIKCETPGELTGEHLGGGTSIDLKVRNAGSISIQDIEYITERRWIIDFSN